MTAPQKPHWVAIAAWIVSIVALGLSTAQFRLSTQALKLNERPWVTLQSARTLGDALSVGSRPRLQAFFQNSGHSPALRKTIWYLVRRSDELPRTSAFPFDWFWKENAAEYPGTASQSVMAPQGPEYIDPFLKDPLTERQVAQLQAGQIELVIVGIVRYDDIFSQSHQTTYCYQTIHLSQDLSPCPQWNTAD